MFVIGLIEGPLHHYFYDWIGKLFKGRSVKSVTNKIIMDQIFMSPICITWFFIGMGLMEGKNLYECGHELREKFVEVYTVSDLTCNYLISNEPICRVEKYTVNFTRRNLLNPKYNNE
jgi:protein Mpv17